MKRLFIFISFFLFTSLSQAKSFFIEPYLNYGLGSYTATENVINKDVSMKIYGLRLGTHVGKTFLMGIDIERTSGSFRSFSFLPGTDVGANTSDRDFTRLSTGVYLGVKVLSFRGWVVYRISDTLNLTLKEEIISEIKQKGRGFKVGVGFTVAPFVSLNFEMTTHKPEENSTLKVKPKSYSIGLSLPLIL